MNRTLIIVIAALGVIIIAVASLVIVSSKKAEGPQAISASGKTPASPKDIKELLAQGKKSEAIKKLEDIVSLKNHSRHEYEALYTLCDIYEGEGNLLKAKELCLTAINEYPNYCDHAAMQKRLSSINMAILFSTIPDTESETYVVAAGDSLMKISRRYSTTIELIKKANNLKTDVIRPGMKLKVNKNKFSIVADKSQSTLTLLSGEDVVKVYTVATGKNNSTPTGAFVIKDKLVNPTWYTAGAIVPADSPDNILGSRWMGLSTPQPGYGIHGTTKPETIGYQSTEGCIRMRNADVEELFIIVPIGTEVTIVD